MIYFLLIFFIPLLDIAKAKDTVEICGKSRDKGTKDCGIPSGGRKFFFDFATKRCQPFVYLGCEGNENRFVTLSECKEKCGNYNPAEGTKCTMALPVPKCNGNVRAAVDEETNVVKCPDNQCPEGYNCDGTKCCPVSKDFVCRLENDSGKYVLVGKHTPRFFYKTEKHNCQLFTYFGALGNANNFESYKDCMNYCKDV
uniref:BPTI/Kunitz inhibitor domain-containing protein n=1 Tax=Globodera rostochiensis TaxID=31243 RepID=A0A914I299_GLORO